MNTLKGPPIDIFTVTETLKAAGEMGIILSVEEAKQVAFDIVKTRFPVCVRDYLARVPDNSPMNK